MPVPPYLISKCDVLDLVRFIMSILSAQGGEMSVARAVQIFKPVDGALQGPGTHVKADEGFGTELLAPRYEL